MSTIAVESTNTRASQVVRLSIWGLIPLVEALALSSWFDFQILWSGLAGAPWWRSVVLQAGQIPRVAVAAGVAALLHGGWSWRDELLRMGDDLIPARRVWPALLAHLGSLGLFVWLTSILVGPDDVLRRAGGELGVGAWAVSGLATLLTWISIALPPARWAGFARRRGGSIGVGVVIGGLAWLAGWATTFLWKPMASGTFALVAMMLRPVFGATLQVYPDRRVIGARSFLIEIAPDCSGYEGIGLVWVILGAYLWLARRGLRFPQALVLLPVGTVLIWLTNAVRIAALVAVGVWISPKVAIGGFHSQAGWLALNAVVLGLILISRHVPWITRGVPAAAEEPVENPTVPYLAPLMVLVAMMMVSSALSDGFDRLYGLRVVATGATLWALRSSYREPLESRSVGAVGLGLVVLALWLALEPRSSPAGFTLAESLYALSPLARFGWIALRVIGSTVLVPIVEELAFRGFLARRVMSNDFEAVDPRRLSLLAMVVSSVAFGAMHQRFVAGALAGLVYAFAYRRRGRIGDAILAHATTNACIAALAVFGGWWSLWA